MKPASFKAQLAALLPWVALLLKRRQRFYLGTLLLLLTWLAGLALLGLSGWFITACALAGLALAAGAPVRLDVYVPGGGIRFFALLRTVARYGERLYNHDTVLRLLADLRYRVFGHLVQLDQAALHRHRASDWLGRLTADIDALDTLYLRLLIPPLGSFVVAVALMTLVAFVLPQAALPVALVLALLWLFCTFAMARWGFAGSHRQVADQETLRRQVVDQLQASTELLAYASADWHRAEVEAQERRALDNQLGLGRRIASGNAVVSVLGGGLVLLLVAFGGTAVEGGELSGPLLVMLLLVFLGANEVFALLPGAFGRLGSSVAAAERLNALSSEAPKPSMDTLPSGALEVVLDGAGYAYPNASLSALAPVSLRLAPGEGMLVTGRSGAGKSTLAALLVGRLVPTEGRVEVGGCAPSRLAEEARAQRIAWLTQQVDLFDASLGDNLRLGNADASDARLWQALKQVALDEWVAALPQGLDTPVGERGQQLSGGQARRVALARLLLMDPSLVLLDEPFAGIDAETAARVAAGVVEWLEGRTVVVFMHHDTDNLLAQRLEHRWHLDAGALYAYEGLA
ncbi:thiol reductant ABC exporter subunit CydC [Halomonas dongshanensis]|uniref:Thiol reductant ABC exporter subunit CydC n=1 Tax=Halomonas dongshanensis TaxID=2890835 RepID=A0ABT2EGH5_9GAMM|nr:thiol reductant ABC exporter subunit CydC [Halomonas dongshanensis]MCS2610220.1 thiol reductant ABC exporter subunit CydC [Halomonas dongshanensis]